MKRIFLLVLLFSLASSFALVDTTSTPNQGVLTLVNGKVQIKSKSGKKTRTAKKNATVVEGERIVTGTSAQATLQLFDGSELSISPKTDFQLTKLQKPSAEDKVIQFKLFVGRLFASVKKLASSRSSFEIEAGGVVCGVRGTKFAFEFDPGKNHVGPCGSTRGRFTPTGTDTAVFSPPGRTRISPTETSMETKVAAITAAGTTARAGIMVGPRPVTLYPI